MHSHDGHTHRVGVKIIHNALQQQDSVNYDGETDMEERYGRR